MPDNSNFELAHEIHPYPCKFPGSVAKQFCIGHGVVLDPFCGSGTTLLETLRLGGSVIGIDCNPIALLITRCKISNYDQKSLRRLKKLHSQLQEILDHGKIPTLQLHNFPGRDHWFQTEVQNEIALILSLIRKVNKASIAHDAANLVLSSIVNRVSRQESETRYAAVEKDFSPGNVIRIYCRKLDKFIKVIANRGDLVSQKYELFNFNFTKKTLIAPNTIDRIVTSPPYANTMDYYLYHKQRMNVLGFSFKDVMQREIGSRHEFSSKKAAPEKWFSDYQACISEMYRLLKKGGTAIIVIGDSQIAGKKICAMETTSVAANAAGFKMNEISSTDMSGKSKSFSTSFQRPGKIEYVIELKK